MWAMILWTSFCPFWLRSPWWNWNIPIVLKLERYDSVTYISIESLPSFLTIGLLLLKMTKKFNKIVTITTAVWIIDFIDVCPSIVLLVYVTLSFIWNRIIGALNLWHTAELPLITIWNTKQLKCLRSVWNPNAVLKNCFQY